MKDFGEITLSISKRAQAFSPGSLLIILNRIAAGKAVSAAMINLIRYELTHNPTSVTNALRSVTNIPGLLRYAPSLIPELSAFISSATGTGAAGAASVVPAAASVTGAATATGAASVAAPAAATGAATAATAATAAGATGATSAAATGIGAAGLVGLGAVVITLAAAPWIMEKWFGSRDEIKTKDQLEATTLPKAEELFEPIWDHDVTTTYNPWAGTAWSSEKSGDLGEIDGGVKNSIIRIILGAALNGQTKNVTTGAILDQLEGTGVADRADMEADAELMSDIKAASDYFTGLANDINSAAKAVARTQRVKSSPAASAATSATIGGTGNCIETSSKIMMVKGYLNSEKTSWDTEFENAFCEYINAGQAKVKLVPGAKSWTSMAKDLGYTPTLTGACDAVKNMANSVPNKGAVPASPSATKEVDKPVAPEVKATEKVSKQDVLAKIISVLYNEKLIDIKGIDFANEKKQITALVDAAGGPLGGGYQNAAKIILKENPSINIVLPDELAVPVNKDFVKANPDLSQSIVLTARKIFEAANPSFINPRLEKATENVRKYLASPEGGNWKVAKEIDERLVKSVEDRKARIMSKVASKLTPEERATARRTKMKESV